MVRFLAILLVASSISVGSISAQESQQECDFDSIRLELSVRISQAESLDELEVVAKDLRFAIAQCRRGEAVSENDAPVATTDGTRTNPIPLGAWYAFDAGRFRVVQVTDPVEDDSLRDARDDHRILGLELQYDCYFIDPERACEPVSQAGVWGFVLDDGRVFESRFGGRYSDPGSFYRDGQRIYAPQFYSGVTYYDIPTDAVAEVLYSLFGGDYVYFALD